MPRLLTFAEDSELPLVLQLGTPRAPVDLTGCSAQILLRDASSNAQITGGTTTVQQPPSAGRVQRAFESGELVPGRRFVVECVVTPPNGAPPRTYPDAHQQPLEVEVVQRRTTPVNP